MATIAASCATSELLPNVYVRPIFPFEISIVIVLEVDQLVLCRVRVVNSFF